MPAHKKPALAPIDPGPSAESLAVCGYSNAVGAVDMAEAGRMIGKSKRRAQELVKEGKLKNSFMHGRDRVVPCVSIALYMAEVRDAGRGHEAVQSEIGLKLHDAKKKRAKR